MKKNAQNVGIDEVSFNDSAFKVRLKRNLEILSNVLANPTTVLGLIIVILMLAMAIFAPVITEPNTPDPYQMPRHALLRSHQGIYLGLQIEVEMYFTGSYGVLEPH